MLKTHVTVLNITPIGKGGKRTAQAINAIRKFTTDKNENGLTIGLLVRKERVDQPGNTDTKNHKKTLPTIKVVVAGISQKNITETVDRIDEFTKKHYATNRPNLKIKLNIQKRETGFDPTRAVNEITLKGLNAKDFRFIDF